MKVYDRNEKHGLALVEDSTQYVSLTEEMKTAPLAEKDAVYLKQLHYCARAHISGLVIAVVDPMLPGWERQKDLDFLEALRR